MRLPLQIRKPPSEMFGIPVSMLRYYDKEGLFPNMERKGGQRHLGDQDDRERRGRLV